jgi:hypothetical protein
LSWFLDEKKREQVLRPDASWRRMLPVQPSAKIGKVVVFEYCTCHFCSSYTGFTTTDEDSKVVKRKMSKGVRMGFIYDLVVYMLETFPPDSGIEIRWRMFPIISSQLQDRDDIPNQNLAENEDEMAIKPSNLCNQIDIYESHEGGCGSEKHREAPIDTGLKVKGVEEEFNPRCIQWDIKPEGYDPSDHKDSDRAFGPPRSFLRDEAINRGLLNIFPINVPKQV